MHARARRGLLSRPTLAEILDYRSHVDEQMVELFRKDRIPDDAAQLSLLGLNHEQQHQELLLTDIKHVLFGNPLAPAACASLPRPPGTAAPAYNLTAAPAEFMRIGARQ